jgi:hypothetical protein
MDTSWLLATAVLALALGALGGGLYVLRLKARLAHQDALLVGLERDMQAVCVGARGMGDAVFRLEDKLRRLTERQDAMALREPDQAVYHQAIRLAHRGASVEELVCTCGLQRGEAELIHILHQAGAGSDEEGRRTAASG